MCSQSCVAGMKSSRNSDVTFDARVVRLPKRHVPQRVVQLQTQVDQATRLRHVAAEQRRQLPAQGHPCCASEGGQVDDQVGLALGRIGQRITQDHAAFGIGVADLDVGARAGLDHVTRAVGVAGDGVFHRRDQQGQLHRQLQRHHQPGQAQGGGGAAHVLLHLAHALRALDVEAA